MRKSIYVLAALCVVLTFAGCKKEQAPEKITPEEILLSDPTEFDFYEKISVSTFGFLVFPTEDDLETYRSYVGTSTHYEVQTYLTGLGFESQGHSIYTTEGQLSSTVEPEEIMDYVLSPDRTFQLDNVVLKPVGATEADPGEVQWEYLLAMREDYLGSSSYEDMADGVYNDSYMNQFATNPDTEGDAIHDIMQLTPTGIEETVPNAVAAARPFWGHGDATCNVGGQWFNPTTNTWNNYYDVCDPGPYYVFWIKVKKAKCHVAYACP